MNVLVIAPHPDDEAIGCGGSIFLHAACGDRVSVVFLTSGELGLKQLAREQAWRLRETEARRAARMLCISSVAFLRLPDWMVGDNVPAAAEALRPVLQQEKAEVIYLPHPNDDHPDHRASLSVLRIAFSGMGSPQPTLRGYEVWTPLREFDHVQDISAVMPRKVRGLRTYRSQLEQFDYVRAVRGLNAYRGALATKSDYAEVFQTLSSS